MFSFILLPLGIYFAVFTFIFCRRYPTVWSGGFDVGFLLFGVVGLLSFGPGKLLIPMYVYITWGAWAVLYWVLIYYVISYCVCNACRNYVIIYNCEFERIIACISELAARLDRRYYIDERVLHLPLIGLHCVIGGSHCDAEDKLLEKSLRKGKSYNEAIEAQKKRVGYVFLKLTGTRANDPAWALFQKELSASCRNLRVNKHKLPFLYSFIAGAILLYSFTNITTDFQTLKTLFIDYWC
ncbi:MAG: hypothetical protein LBJ00_13085 [Planctomycetaceae bacterium]|jgi:hypothetical protein|nr:hypothetical protein [Planctomycetaceae bacterium]